MPGVRISRALQCKLNKRMILEDEALAVIAHCEETGAKLLRGETGTWLGRRKLGHMTYWVEYAFTEEGIRLIKAYCHRMSIEG